MKVKELILELQSEDQESEVTIAVYDCCGYNNSYPVTDIEGLEYEGQLLTQLGIYPGCDTHNKWLIGEKCPINNFQKEILKIEELKKSLDRYSDRINSVFAIKKDE